MDRRQTLAARPPLQTGQPRLRSPTAALPGPLMKSGHPEEAAPQGDLLVMVSGTSIELKALQARLESRGLRLLALSEGLSADASNTLSPRLVICDLASDGALAALAQFYARVQEPAPPLVTLGSARGNP